MRRAIAGDSPALNALVARLQPLLLLQARYRLGPRGLGALEPEDLVAETWMVALDRLAEFDLETEHATARLVAFLAQTLRFRANNHLRRAIHRRAQGAADSEDSPQIEDPRTGHITRLVRAERGGALHEALAALTDEQREVVILRSIEGLDNREVARRLRLEPSAVSHRFQRALERLRKSLGPSILDELATERE